MHSAILVVGLILIAVVLIGYFRALLWSPEKKRKERPDYEPVTGMRAGIHHVFHHVYGEIGSGADGSSADVGGDSGGDGGSSH